MIFLDFSVIFVDYSAVFLKGAKNEVKKPEGPLKARSRAPEVP